MLWSASAVVHRPLQSERTVWPIESPNFTLTAVPVWSTTTSDMTSPATSGRKLSLKNCRQCCIRRLWVEFLQNASSENHEIISISGWQSVSQTCRIWHHYLLLVGGKMQLNTVQKCAKLVQPAKSRIIRSLDPFRGINGYWDKCRLSSRFADIRLSNISATVNAFCRSTQR